MRRALALALAVLAPAGPAAAATATVDAQFDAFGPSVVDVLPGETVHWQNVSERTHTVTADDGLFDAELPAGGAFDRVFDVSGLHPYHCTLHPTMTGTIAVSAVVLGPLPVAAVPAGDPVVFDGRTADPAQAVRVERAVAGGWETIGTAQPAPDGTWTLRLPARASGDYRAADDAGASRTRPLLVSDRRVLVQRTSHGLAVSVSPPLPYGRVVLQRLLRDRFGWWPARRARLDYRSRAFFPLRGGAPARVALVAADGWSAVATSSVVGRPPPAPPAPHAHPGRS